MREPSELKKITVEQQQQLLNMRRKWLEITRVSEGVGLYEEANKLHTILRQKYPNIDYRRVGLALMIAGSSFPFEETKADFILPLQHYDYPGGEISAFITEVEKNVKNIADL